MTTFNANSTTKDVIAGISLAGKVAVVTGASAGLGIETARVLASAGAGVLLVARNPEKLKPVLQSLREQVPGAQFDSALMDLSDLDSVRTAAADIAARYPCINLLINNAGVMACPLGRTAQGFELQFGTNHLGHFLFTNMLLSSLQAAAAGSGEDSRVISLSSAGHRFGGVDFDDPNYENREYEKWAAYGQSKTANALFAVGLDTRLKAKGVRAFAVHPGVIMTELGRYLAPEEWEALKASRPAGEEMTFKSIEQGAATSVWGATSLQLQGLGGLYLEDCHIAEPAAPAKTGGIADFAADPALADRLWALSETLVGQSGGSDS
jgi:NAD(P)-dependent dehydrogenase (short-subunit alcohol dehydrogenase family)